MAEFKTRKALGGSQGLWKMRNDVFIVVPHQLTRACCNVKPKNGLSRGLFVLPFSGGTNLKEVWGHE